MVDANVFLALVGILLGGSGVGAFVAFKKAAPEAESISVTTLRGVIEEMREELSRKDKQIKEQNVTIGRCTEKIDQQNDKIEQLADRIIQLEMNPPSHLG